MAFAMASMKRSKSGAYTARKGIPKDVRAEYQRLYQVAWEAQFYVPPGTSLASAKAQFSDWLAEIECRVAAIRASVRGEGRELTRRQAHALAGEWYRWFVSRHEDQPGEAAGWTERKLDFVDRMRLCAPDWFSEHMHGEEGLWLRDADVRLKVRPLVADVAETAQFLASRGLVLSEAARASFVDSVEDAYWEALTLLERRANRDYGPDERLKAFPAFTETPVPFTGETCWQLFERWVSARLPRRPE